MKVLRRVLVGLVLCFAFVFVLVSCSNVSKSYADKINNAYNQGNGTALTYESVKKDLGDECIDLTDKDHVAGMLVAVKGLTASNYKEKLDKASDNDRYEFIAITVVQGRCTYALYSASATPGEVRAGMLK